MTQNYGDAKENFQDIADLWSVFLKTEINAEQVAVCMILMKCARLMKSNHMDVGLISVGMLRSAEKSNGPTNAHVRSQERMGSSA